MPVTSSAAASANSGAEQPLDMRLEPEIEPRLHRLARRAGELLVGDDAHARLAARPRRRSACRPAAPIQRMRAVGGQHELRVGRLRELGGARVDLAGQRLLRRGLQAPWPPSPPAEASGANVKPSSRPMAWPSTTTSPVLLISVSNIVFSRSRRINTLVRRSTKRSVSRSCSASESLSSTRARDALPMLRIGQPVRTVGHEGPGPDMRDPVRERIDVAVGPVGLRHLAGEPVDRGFYPPASGNHRGSSTSSACVAGAILR